MHNGERAQKQLERLTFFSDAVFAIAMTLLVIEIRVPELHELSDAALAQGLIDLAPKYIGFVISFLVTARFWTGHHIVMGMLKACDSRLIWLNMMTLMVVAFMPFPTAVLSDYVQLRVAVGFYAAWLTLLGLIYRWLISYAVNNRALMRDDVDPADIALLMQRSWTPLILGPLAFIVGMIAPVLAMLGLVVGSGLLALIMRGRKRRR